MRGLWVGALALYLKLPRGMPGDTQTMRDRARVLGNPGVVPALICTMLVMAGSDERVAAWAVQHHEPEERWTIPVDVGRLLVLADDGRL